MRNAGEFLPTSYLLIAFHIHSFSLSKSTQLCSLLSAEWYPLYPYKLKRCNISEELNIEGRDSPEYLYLSFH